MEVAAGADLPATGGLERFFERATQVCLVVFVFASPHSIAATQGAFLLGCVCWIGRMIAARKFLFARTAIDIPLALFVGWTVVSVATSMDPAWSADRLRGVSLFFIMYLFATNVPTKRFAWGLALVLAVSVLGNLGLTYYQRIEGRGVKVTAMHASPLEKWGIEAGDTIVEVGGRRVRTIEDVNAAFDGGSPRDQVPVRYTRGEYDITEYYRRDRISRDADTAGPERLAIEVAPGRDFRAQGFFSTWATYAETLQLIGSLVVGWIVVAASRREWRWAAWLAALAVLVAGALIQTQTRAPLVAFAIAVVAMVVLRGQSRARLGVAAAIAVLVVAVGAAVIMRGRDVSLWNLSDDSTAWRLEVWREALPLLAAHPLVGIGPDAAKPEAQTLHLFENGKLPPGHFHSTPLQLAVDRGLPTLAAWLALVATFVVSVARFVRRLGRRETADEDWRVTATALGAWGGFLGFVASSLVHFNWGDSEPMEMAWCLMGLVFAIARLTPRDESEAP
jgi:hypothetical protein